MALQCEGTERLMHLNLPWRRLQSDGDSAVYALGALVGRLAWLDRLRLIADGYELGRMSPQGACLLFPIVHQARTDPPTAGLDPSDPSFAVTFRPPDPWLVALTTGAESPLTIDRVSVAPKGNKLTLWLGASNAVNVDPDTLKRLAMQTMESAPPCIDDLLLAQQVSASTRIKETPVLQVLGRQGEPSLVMLDALQIGSFTALLELVAQAISLGMRHGATHPLVLCLAQDVVGEANIDLDAIVAVDATGDRLLRRLRRLAGRAAGIRHTGPPYWGSLGGQSIVCLPVTPEPHASAACAGRCVQRVRREAPTDPERLVVLWEPSRARPRLKSSRRREPAPAGAVWPIPG
jgi:hypothetical protein